MVIEIPEQLKDLVSPLTAIVALAKRAVVAPASRAIDYGEFEAEVAKRTAALEVAVHQSALNALNVDAPQVAIGAQRYRRIGTSEASYYTLAGPARVQRTLYREMGVRNGPAVDPVSLRAGVVGDGWLPRAAQAMAHQVQRGTSREAEAGSVLVGRLPYSRCSFERVGHAVAAQYKRHRQKVEDALIELVPVPTEARSVSVSVDRVSIPMEEPRQRPPGRPRKGAAKNPVKRVFHMGYCATVTLHDGTGDSLQTIRYGRMPHADAFFLGNALACDVDALLRQRPDLQVVLLADGAKEMWGILDEHVSAIELDLPKRQVSRMIDLWHVLEKLGKAARVAYGDDIASEVLHRWRMQLLNRSTAAAKIADQLRNSGCEGTVVDGERPVHNAITYLDNNGDRMNYASARRRGLPLGSGNVEATCKSLVAQRMKRAGSRWKEDTGDDILQLRALALSDRWEPAMKLVLKHLRQSVIPLKVAA